MKVLVACEYSGRVRQAFQRKGHDAWSVDLLPSEDGSPQHIQGDALHVMRSRAWDLVIAHPPCTFLCNSGVRWLYRDGTRYAPRWEAMRQAADFFSLLWCEGPARMAIENPVMHGHAAKLVWVRPAQIIQPWQFGHGETKATCLWLRGLPLLRPTNVVDGREARIHRMSPSPERWKERSRTYQGIADAMAEQWGGFIE